MLAGLFDTDGWIGKDGTLGFGGTYPFVEEVPRLLDSCGIRILGTEWRSVLIQATNQYS